MLLRAASQNTDPRMLQVAGVLDAEQMAPTVCQALVLSDLGWAAFAHSNLQFRVVVAEDLVSCFACVSGEIMIGYLLGEVYDRGREAGSYPLVEPATGGNTRIKNTSPRPPLR